MRAGPVETVAFSGASPRERSKVVQKRTGKVELPRLTVPRRLHLVSQMEGLEGFLPAGVTEV